MMAARQSDLSTSRTVPPAQSPRREKADARRALLRSACVSLPGTPAMTETFTLLAPTRSPPPFAPSSPRPDRVRAKPRRSPPTRPRPTCAATIPTASAWCRATLMRCSRAASSSTRTSPCARPAAPCSPLDGQQGYGQVIGQEAMELGAGARPGARRLRRRPRPLAPSRAGSASGPSSASRHGLVSIHFVNVLSRPIVAPFGGRDARIGTNPFCVGIPRPGRRADRPRLRDQQDRPGQDPRRLQQGSRDRARDADRRPWRADERIRATPSSSRCSSRGYRVRGQHKGAGLALMGELLGGGGASPAARRRAGRARVMERRRLLQHVSRSSSIEPTGNGREACLAVETCRGTSPTRRHRRRRPASTASGRPASPSARRGARRLVEGIPVDSVTWGEIVVPARRSASPPIGSRRWHVASQAKATSCSPVDPRRGRHRSLASVAGASRRPRRRALGLLGCRWGAAARQAAHTRRLSCRAPHRRRSQRPPDDARPKRRRQGHRLRRQRERGQGLRRRIRARAAARPCARSPAACAAGRRRVPQRRALRRRVAASCASTASTRLAAPPAPVLVSDRFPSATHHGRRFIAFGPDGKLYVPVGAPCNVCGRSERYATSGA